MVNENIIKQFKLLIKQINAEITLAKIENQLKEQTMHKFRLVAIKKVLNILEQLDFEITDVVDVAHIPQFKKGTLDRIAEILETGTLSELKEKYDENKEKQKKIEDIQKKEEGKHISESAVNELTKVIGIGEKTAKKIITDYGINSVKALRQAIKAKKIKVSESIRMGLKYHDIYKKNIPRAEITLIEKYLKKVAHKIDPGLKIIICGSYRRGKPTSNDVDLLLYYHNEADPKETASNKTEYLDALLEVLTKNKFIVDSITYKKINKKYMGFCKYEQNPVRRIDIRFVSYADLPTAMLYFTGPYELNRIMRSAAIKKNMKLNEYGLYSQTPEGKFKKIRVREEKDVFKKLDMAYLTPEKRESFNTGKGKSHKL